jgi:hypothetical protein
MWKFISRLRLNWAVCASLLSGVAMASETPSGANQPVDFNRDVKPILSNICYKCHGPDAAERKGGSKAHPLRLDTEEGALVLNGGTAAIVPGHPEKSELITRIASKDEDQIMPPLKSGKPLPAHEIEVLKRWIAQGGKYARHWSYVKPYRPALPEVKDKAWPRNAIDSFILARLEKEGLKPQAEAVIVALRAGLHASHESPVPDRLNPGPCCGA